MSRDRPRRNCPSIDYKEFNETGRKVVKEIRDLQKLEEKLMSLPIMATEKLFDEERKINLKLDRFIDEFEFDLLFDIEEIQGGISELKVLLDKYEEIHIELQRELNEEYEKKYKDFASKLGRMKDWIKGARIEIKRRRSVEEEEKVRKEGKEKEELLAREKAEKEELLAREKTEKEELLAREKTEKEELLAREKKEKEELLAREKKEKEELLSKEKKEKEESLRKEKEDADERFRKQKNALRTKERYLREKIEQDIAIRIDICSPFVEDIERNICDLNEYIREYLELVLQIENTFGDQFEVEFANICRDHSSKMNSHLRDMMNQLMQKKEENSRLSSLREKESKEREHGERKNIFNGIYEIICERAALLESKYKKSLCSLSDSQTLEKAKEVKLLDAEFNDILDRAAELVKASPSDYDKADEVLNDVRNKKINLKNQKDQYQKDLDQQIIDRDLSPEKIKNATTLNLEVPKFHGYGSKLDFYTFKYKFEKLISPHVQAKLLPDYLKSNYLEGHALELVKEIDQLEDMWERLKTSFGSVEILLSNKLDNIVKGDQLWKLKNGEKLIQSIIKVTNAMKELITLAEKHKIEESLFHQSNLVKIYNIIGKSRQFAIMKENLKKNLSVREEWESIIIYLNDELELKEKILMLEKSNFEEDRKIKPENKAFNVHNQTAGQIKTCAICGKTDHIATLTRSGKSIINYFACPLFSRLNPLERLAVLNKKGLCSQCLAPGFKRGHSGSCFNQFSCPDESHKTFDRGYHVLVCHKHKNNPKNQQLLEDYKAKWIKSDSHYKDFSKNIAISFHVCGGQNVNSNSAIFMLQTVQIQGKRFNIFFDSGCGDLVCSKKAVTQLEKMGRANRVIDGPITISGVGDQKTVCQNGLYNIKIPLYNGKDVSLSGICMDKITGEMPIYPMKDVEKDIHQAYLSYGADPKKLPKLPHSVGGETDLLIGIQYLRYFPEKVFTLENGLTIYKSQFSNTDGSRGLVGGPHRIFTEIQKGVKSNTNVSVYLNTPHENFRLSVDLPLLGKKHIEPFKVNEGIFVSKRPPKASKRFEEVELAGADVSYRCVRCRNCADCKNGERIDCVSIQEEVEQVIIEKSVTVDLDNGCTHAKLPFLCDPTQKLASNRNVAKKIYEGQVKKLSKNLDDKLDVIQSEKKLQELGFVDFLENLSIEQQNKIINSPVNYYIPWRSVWNMNSVSTRCRLVFDASHPTRTGASLNSLLAKGRNNMNKLVELGLRWQVRRHAFHTDIRKMYNTIKLHEDHWCYQLYLWSDHLDIEEDPKVKIIKTLIYGVKPSGNQAEQGIRETGNLMKEEYPRQHEIINKDIYVDDCVSGDDDYDSMCETMDGLKLVLNKGGFDLKGFTVSGFNPPDDLSNEDNSINVVGMKWYPKADLLSLNIGELNFGKKNRGKKVIKLEGLIPDEFTRRDCAGKVAEIFDLLGKFTPITAGLKLDLSKLSKRNLDWDDYVPDDLKNTWKSNFQLIQDIGQVKFNRAIIPEDAVNLNIETIEVSDASQDLACSAVYARFKRKSGLYSCQLLFSRSKIIPKGMTIPRAELFAAQLNACTGQMVYLSLKDLIKTRIHLTDSQVVLFWINNVKSQMKQWVRNRVIEITRLTNRSNWYHIDSENNLADLGTRKGATLSDVLENSTWINGHEWTKHLQDNFPIKSVNEIKLSNNDIQVFNDESLVLNDEWIKKQLGFLCSNNYPAICEGVRNNVSERYKFSRYVIDPNKFRFRKVVRILALVFLFIRNLKLRAKVNTHLTVISTTKLPKQFKISDKYLTTQNKGSTNTFPFNCQEGLVVTLNDNILMTSLNYFFKKATLEIKEFCPKRMYQNISTEKNEVLYYSGRILPSQEFNGQLNLSDVCLDLTMSSFCVPLIEKHSPLAYALINEIHWYHNDAKHSGNETVLRFVQQIAYIMEGRLLVKRFRKDCARCKILQKKAIEVAMGPISDANLCIAPAFFNTQVDIFGPLNSYSNVNKRSSIKVWFVIFCCITTGAVDIKVMEDYSTESFILAFVRFSCKYGYPKKLMPDAGSQLVRGCQTIILSFSDIKGKLYEEYGVDFETCPVGAHYMHGKVERKIRHVQESFSKCINNNRLSIIRWETLGDQIANGINNLPIAIGNIVQDLENLDILTPNRLILGRNNNRCPVGVLTVTDDPKRIIQANNNIYCTWFKCWLISYVPTLMFQPKWYNSNRDSKIGDVVLFLKSDKEFDKQYQYGIITGLKMSRDGKIREVEVEYKNHTENVKRHTNRGVREIVVIHPVNELGIMREINALPNIR